MELNRNLLNLNNRNFGSINKFCLVENRHKAHFPLGEFVSAKRKTNLGNVTGQQKKFAAKKLDQFLLSYCLREQIRLVENGLKS
jgi:hypothetical protein